MTTFGNDPYSTNPLVERYSNDDDSMDELTPGMSLCHPQKMRQDKHEPLFVLPVSYGLNQDYHIPTEEERQSTSDPSIVEDNLVFRECGMDLKTLLNQFCQRVCRRPVTKEDILYTTIQHGPSQFSATVKLNCVGGGEFRGGVCSNRRAAQKSAAQEALQAHKTLLSMLYWTNKPKVGQQEQHESNESHSSRSSLSDRLDTCLNLEKEFMYEPPAANPTMTGKSVLNTACMKILRRAMRKGDIVYERSVQAAVPVPKYCCAVKLPCLPGPWGSKVWVGKVCSSQKAAEQCAAVVAVESIFEDPELGPLASSTSKQKYPKAYGPGNLQTLKVNSFSDHSLYTQHANCFYTQHANWFYDGLYDNSQIQYDVQPEFVIAV